MEIEGCGVLITGASGTGKGELALELIDLGHRLVADDAPVLRAAGCGALVGSSPAILRGFLHVHELGVLNIRAMYGPRSIKPFQRLDMIAHLEPDRQRSSEHCPVERRVGRQRLGGVSLPCCFVPADPRRSRGVLVAALARDHRLRSGGYDAVEDFVARQRRWIEQNSVRPVEYG
jgi:serine kinase of HPr protein (carbohydrate metabolism regulator)